MKARVQKERKKVENDAFWEEEERREVVSVAILR